MAVKIDLSQALARLRQEYLESTIDKIDEIDSFLEAMRGRAGNWSAMLLEVQRYVHTIKGSSASFGFPTVGHIAHRLEDYLETVREIDERELSDVQIYIDRMREIIEKGSNPSDDDGALLLRALPSIGRTVAPVSSFSTQQVREIGVVFVMPKTVQRKIVAMELASCGFHLSMVETGIQAIESVLASRPDIVVASQELKDMTGVELARLLKVLKATRRTRFILMTSLSPGDPRLSELPPETAVVHKGINFSDQLTTHLIRWGVFGDLE